MTTVNNFPNYLIYPDGKCWSIKNKIFLTPCKHSKGYKTYHLCNNGHRKAYLIHRLIGEYYIPNPYNLPFIDHKNNIRSDNRIENLHWVSKIENCNNVLARKDTKSGHKNIYTVRKKNNNDTHYRFQKQYNGKRYTKDSTDLSTLIEYRNKWYKDNLPDYCSSGLDI